MKLSDNFLSKIDGVASERYSSVSLNEKPTPTRVAFSQAVFNKVDGSIFCVYFFNFYEPLYPTSSVSKGAKRSIILTADIKGKFSEADLTDKTIWRNDSDINPSKACGVSPEACAWRNNK